MFAVSGRRTMANAVPVPDTGINLKPRVRVLTPHEAHQERIRVRRARERRETLEEIARLEAKKAEMDAAIAKAVAKYAVPTPRSDVKSIIGLVARMHGVTYAEVKGDKRTRVIAGARQAAICAVKQAHPTYSLPQIGRYFGRDHTTVLHAFRIRGFEPNKDAA